MQNPTGVLLINLGTPKSPSVKDVRAFLGEFLRDPYVIDASPTFRWLLLNFVILPFRPRIAAAAYQKIWTAQGSPLLFHTRRAAEKLQNHLGADFLVRYALRYGAPSIESTLTAMLNRGFSRLIVIPLYPQYASSTFDSTKVAVLEVIQKMSKDINVIIAEPFYSDLGFIGSFAAQGKKAMPGFSPDHILFSFHGLPESHIRNTELVKNYCLKPDFSCCNKITEVNAKCYRAQCVQTAKYISEQLNISTSDYSVAFQSRLGRTPWIRPYTNEVIPQLASSGKKKLLVFSPSFVADCVETLEEIDIRGRESFLKAGGKSFMLVPSLNAEDHWIEALAQITKKTLEQKPSEKLV